MAITFVNKSAFASGTGALTVGAVTSVAANDIILLFVESANQAVTTPTGYTIVTSSPVSTGTAAAAGGVRLSVFYQLATGADTTTTVADSGDHTNAIKLAYRGIDIVTPFDATPVTGIKTPASTSSSFPGITTATNNAIIVLASALDLDAASTTTTGTPTNANLTGLVERHDQTVIAGVGGGLVIIEGAKAIAGATGATTATVTSTIQVYLTIALREENDFGTLNATETGSDTFAASGTVVNSAITGSMAVLEVGDDTFSASGTVSSPSINGSLSATEIGNDSFSATGNVIVSGALAVSEVGNDTFSGSGSVLVQGSLSATETGSDTFAASGTVSTNTVTGVLSVSEVGNDALQSAGLVLIYGGLAANESGNDSFSSSGNVVVSGSLGATEQADQLGSYAVDGYVVEGYTKDGWEGLVLIQGGLSVSEAGEDSFSSSGTVVDQKSNAGITGGGIRRSKILEAAQWILDLLDKDTVKQTEQVKKVKARLKKVKKPKDLEDLQPIVNAAIVEVQKQKKLANDIAQLNFIINELKLIKNQLNDEEEALLMLMA